MLLLKKKMYGWTLHFLKKKKYKNQKEIRERERERERKDDDLMKKK